MAQQLGQRLHWQAVGDPNTLSEKFRLALNQIHLWRVPLTISTQQSTLALTLLNEHQREKYQRRREPAQQQAYLAGRYYLLTLLSFYEQLPAKRITFGYSRFNKPFLTNALSNLQFNYTDTQVGQQNIGLFAFCLNTEVGVDLEARARAADFSQIAARRFTPAELNYVKYNADTKTSDSAESVDPERCLAIWTRKEAFGKATGKGINFTMNQHNLAPGPKPYELDFNDDTNSPWRLNQLEVNDDLIACLVHAGHTPLELKAFSL